jgi:peptidoglycan-associated lipoprotein
MQGGFAQGTFALNEWLRIAAEVTGGHANNIGPLGQNLTLMTYAAGPQVVLGSRRFELFGQALFGAAHGSDSYFPSGSTASPSATSFALSTGGGLDFTLSHHVAIRVAQVQYLRTTLPNGTNNQQNQLMLGAGIVLRLHNNWWSRDPGGARAKAIKQMENQPAEQRKEAAAVQPQAAPQTAPPATATATVANAADTSDFADKVKSALFDYDSYQLRPDAKAALEGDAAYLKSHPSLRVIVGGYADERGTAEYNLALGEKRAQVARDALIFNGVSPDQLDVVSYGKEVQTCEVENEACFQQNRRAGLEPRK